MATWDKISEEKCQGVHPDLVAVVRRAFEISPRRCVVHEGRRTMERQRYLVSIGKSFTLDGRHLTGHAVDVYQLDEHGIVTWDYARYQEFDRYMAQAAAELQIPIEWRGNYTMKSGKVMKDGPHFQLPRRVYP